MKKILYISLLILLLTGCSTKSKEKEKSGISEKQEQEQIEKAKEDIYLVMSRIMVEYQISEQIQLPFTVICNEKKGCTYGNGEKMDLEVIPKSGTFTLKDESLLFEITSDIVIGEYSCSINDKNIVTCRK
ncbi:MAG: hypothetical protein HFH08_03955 [Bacilli bacterium]|nr:hypothetical protein [Bacilli bacterium]